MGIVGHEQGGLLAAVIAAKVALGMGPKTLKFAVISGAAMPQSGPMATLLQAARDAPGASDIQTLHCLSTSNPVTPYALSEELAACFPSSELLWHDNGKALPGNTWWKECNGFPDRATGRTEYVGGMYG